MERKSFLPNLTATEPSRQTSAIRKKQNVGHRRPQLDNKFDVSYRKKYIDIFLTKEPKEMRQSTRQFV